MQQWTRRYKNRSNATPLGLAPHVCTCLQLALQPLRRRLGLVPSAAHGVDQHLDFEGRLGCG
eukprot:12928167-Prorocentrum_lima.AAC.1